MLRDLTSRQIAEWIAFYCVEPFGERANDARHAMQTAAICNRGRGKTERTYRAQEFQLHKPPPRPEADPTSLWDQLKAFFGAGKPNEESDSANRRRIERSD